MIKGTFTKQDTNFFKGVAIMMIVIHNYLHWIPGFGLENEAYFVKDNFPLFLEHLKSLEFTRIVSGLFGFLGHYGVQIFIVFSAYGLSIQYAKTDKKKSVFVLEKIKKIYFLLAFAILFTIVFFAIIGSPFGFKEILLKTFLLGTTLSSFFKNSLYAMFSGPFWFFALILQVYIFFPFIYKMLIKASVKKLVAIVLVVYVLIFTLYLIGENQEINILGKNTYFVVFGNLIGHLPEVFLGILLARFQHKGFSIWLIFLAFVVFIGSQLSEYLFPFSFLAISILLIEFIRLLQRIPSKKFEKIILYFGTVSMMLFIVNGPLRYLPLFDVEPLTKFWRLPLFLLILLPLNHILYKGYMLLMKYT